MDICKFRVSIPHCDIPASEGALPIYDAYGNLVGGFTVEHGDVAVGFLSTRDNQIALKLTTDDGFWFCPEEGADGQVCRGVVAEWPINSVKAVMVPRVTEVAK